VTKTLIPAIPGRANTDVTRLWWLSLGLSGVVVAVVAALLGQIVKAARSVDEHANGIWIEGKQIAGNTVSIWMLAKTNEHLVKATEAARALDRTAAAMDETLRSLATTRPGST
jgi:hypothetical protein